MTGKLDSLECQTRVHNLLESYFFSICYVHMFLISCTHTRVSCRVRIIRYMVMQLCHPMIKEMGRHKIYFFLEAMTDIRV
jgi:hypothetical protein